MYIYALSKRIILFMLALIVSMTDIAPAYGERINEEYELFDNIYTDKYPEYALYGYKDSNGSVVIPCEYTHLYGFIDGGCVATKCVTLESGIRHEKVYLIDKENIVLCQLDYYANYLSYREDWYKTAQCFVVYDENMGVNRVINRQGKEALADKYSYTSAYQSGPYIIIVLNENDEMCINRFMQASLGGKHFEEIYSCMEDTEGNLFFPVREGGLLGVVNENGEYITSPVYAELTDSLVYPCYEAYYPDGTFTYASYDGQAMELPEEWIETYW